jgi:hypothetical protein
MASRMQLRRCGERSVEGTDDVDRTVSGGRPCSASNHRQRRRRVQRLATSWRWRWAGGGAGGAGPLAGGTDRLQRTGEPPLMMRAGGTPRTSRPQPDQIFQDRISLPAESAGYPHPRNGPFLLNRRVPDRKFVIAVADGGFLKCLPKQIPA